MLKFRDFDYRDRDLVQQYTLSSPFRNCDLAFANLFVWKFLYDTKICDYNGFLYIMYWHNSKPYFMLPLGKGDLKEAVDNIIKYSESKGIRFCIQGLSPRMKSEIDRLFPDMFSFSINREYSDYLYLKQDLKELKGKKYQAKRNHINKFNKIYPNYEFVPITDDIIGECMAFENFWKNQTENGKESLALDNERRAIGTAFKYFKELGLMGGALKVNNRVVAFTFGSPINEETFDVAVEKADINFQGSYAVVNNEFAKMLPDKYIYINREEDLGISGLRRAKLSYHPIEILDKNTAKFII